MDDPEYEIHPLDRDYSSPTPSPYGKPVEYDTKLRRVGIAVFGAGFAMLFLVAIVLGSFGGSGPIETIGSGAHRFGMVLILIGGILIIVAYRLPHLKGAAIRMPSGQLKWNATQSFSALIVWNLIALVVIALLAQLLNAVSGWMAYFMIVNGALSVTFAMLATIAVWHRGFVRAYAVGAMAALVPNAISGLYVMANFWGGDRTIMLIGNVFFVLATGVLCGAYVLWLESDKPGDSDQRQS